MVERLYPAFVHGIILGGQQYCGAGGAGPDPSCNPVILALEPGIIARGNAAALMNFNLNQGDATIAFAVLLWSIYTVMLRHRPTVHPLSFLAATLVIGLMVIAPFYATEIAGGRLIKASRESALAIGYVAIFPSFFAYLFFNRGVELIGATATGQFLNIMPIMGAGLAMLFLGEQLHVFHITGIALIFAGIFVAGKATLASSLTRGKD